MWLDVEVQVGDDEGLPEIGNAIALKSIHCCPIGHLGHSLQPIFYLASPRRARILQEKRAKSARGFATNVPPTQNSAESASAMDKARWFEEQVRPHENALRSYLRRRIPCDADVDDVVQDSYVKLLRAQHGGGLTRGYLFTIARNTALNLFRKRRFFSATPYCELADELLTDERSDTVASANANLENERLANVIAGLPTRCRQILLMQFTDGLSPSEIAERLGLAESTVRTQLARGIERCVKELGNRGGNTD